MVWFEIILNWKEKKMSMENYIERLINYVEKIIEIKEYVFLSFGKFNIKVKVKLLKKFNYFRRDIIKEI